MPPPQPSDGTRLRDLPRSTPLKFVTGNPKQIGSGSWARFDNYKRATTVQEFLDLGGLPGDLRWDAKRGFVTIAEPELASFYAMDQLAEKLSHLREHGSAPVRPGPSTL